MLTLPPSIISPPTVSSPISPLSGSDLCPPIPIPKPVITLILNLGKAHENELYEAITHGGERGKGMRNLSAAAKAILDNGYSARSCWAGYTTQDREREGEGGGREWEFKVKVLRMDEYIGDKCINFPTA